MRHVVVVGAGLAGAATAWRLAAGGDAVTLVERDRPASRAGSSHGSARIFRHAYPDPAHTALTVTARAEWTELEEASGRTILTPTAGLDFGVGRDLEGISASLAAAGLAFERLSPDAARERWPHVSADTDVIAQPSAAVIDADLAVRSMVELALAAGARLMTATTARLARDGARWIVHAGDELLSADTVVLAAGAWLPAIAADLGLAVPALTVTQQSVFYLRRPETAGDWPVFVHKGELSVYALPAGRDRPGAIKIAEHDRGRVTTADGRDGNPDPASLERITEFVRRHLPAVDPEPIAAETCLYTSTPNERFLIDRLDGLVIVSACSGHAAKFAPLIGSIAADLVRGGDGNALFR